MCLNLRNRVNTRFCLMMANFGKILQSKQGLLSFSFLPFSFQPLINSKSTSCPTCAAVKGGDNDLFLKHTWHNCDNYCSLTWRRGPPPPPQPYKRLCAPLIAKYFPAAGFVIIIKAFTARITVLFTRRLSLVHQFLSALWIPFSSEELLA